MYVVVIGGGNVGYYLTKELLTAGHEVVMIEKNGSRGDQLVEVAVEVPAKLSADGEKALKAFADAADLKY